jgi:hypothetical protein
MKWKEITARLHEQLSQEQSALHIIHDHGRGTWIPVRPFLEREGEVSLKQLRRWLWERRACRLLKRKTVCLWGLVEGPMTYYGVAVKVDGPVLHRWMRIGGPRI